MTSDDYLINHAYRNVWCAPDQDSQYIICPDRISAPIGAKGSVDLNWRRYTLPTATDWYHLFVIGDLNIKKLNLDFSELNWTSAGNQMIKRRMILDIYTDTGKMIPRERVFFLKARDGNIVVAVQATKIIADFGYTPIWLRFYSNAYFNRAEGNGKNQGIEYRYYVPATTDQIATISRTFRDMEARPGLTSAWVNGWKVQAINQTTIKRGDLVEIVRDSSVKAVMEFPIKDLPVFLSELDSQQKYLVRQKDKNDLIIDYRDDLDFYLLRRANANVYTGVLYHKNQDDAVRMITHRDYSVSVNYVNRFTIQNPNWAVMDQLTLQVIVRHSGLSRPLIDEAGHIKELYKLPEQERLAAMVGSDATVDVWKVAALEKSLYTAIMSAKPGSITRPMVEGAYGYNAISRLIADTPQRITDVNRWIELPFGLRGESTIYEYDREGRLLDWYVNTNTQWYVAASPQCHYIEGIVGRGGVRNSTVYARNAPIKPGINYRCYTCEIVNGEADGIWKDVTGTDLYTVSNNTVVWAVDPLRVYTAVKYDDSFLAYDLELNYQDGLLRFSLNILESNADETLFTNLVEINGALLELWLNGRSLIEGLDWFMKGKEICIVNKAYRRLDNGPDRISIRMTGFCNTDMTRVKQDEFGFVEKGYLSRNNRWNLRDDKVIRVTAAGRLYSREELSWAEDRPGVTLKNVPEGAPYQVLEPVIPLRGATLEDTYKMRAVALESDRQIEDYMTAKMGEVKIEGPILIEKAHLLYSPFVAKIMHDLGDGFILEEQIRGTYSDNLIKEIGSAYEWLLEYEPTRKGFDEVYVWVDPHELDTTYELGIFQYNFLRRVIRYYLQDKIDISQHITIRKLT